jgi:hypothetical protein
MSKKFSLPVHFLILSDDDIPGDVLIECEARFPRREAIIIAI